MSSHASDQARVIPLHPAAPAPAAREPLWRHVVGDVLRRERLAQERTLKDVAEAARISMPYLSELERGRKEASSEVLAAAAQALGLGLADLLARGHGELARQARAASAREAGAARGTRAAGVRTAPVAVAPPVTSVTSATSVSPGAGSGGARAATGGGDAVAPVVLLRARRGRRARTSVHRYAARRAA